MTTRNFTSSVSAAEGWVISRRDATDGTAPFTLVQTGDRLVSEIAAGIVEAAAGGSIEHRAALTFLHDNEPLELARVASLAGHRNVDELLLARICKWRAGIVHGADPIDDGMSVMLFDRSEYVRAAEVKKWDVASFPQHHDLSTRVALFEAAHNAERYAGLRGGKMVLFDPQTGSSEQPFFVDFRAFSLLGPDGRLFAPLWAAPSEIMAKALSVSDSNLQAFVKDCLAAFPLTDEHSRGYSQGEIFAVDVVTGAAQDVLSTEDLALAVSRYRTALASDEEVPLQRTKAMLDEIGREALSRRHPDQIVPINDEDDEEDLEDEFDTEVLASAQPVLDLPSFKDPHFRAQARQWLTPSMGEGFPLDDMVIILEGSNDSPVIDMLMERMSNDETVSYPAVRHGQYETSEMTSLEANGYRAVVFSDFMGRYAYVLPAEGLAPRQQPNAAPTPSF